MKVLVYLLVPVLVVTVAAAAMWLRNRQPTSLQSGVESFRREMDALSPDANPLHRRRAEPPSSSSPAPPAGTRRPAPPRRPPNADRRA